MAIVLRKRIILEFLIEEMTNISFFFTPNQAVL